MSIDTSTPLTPGWWIQKLTDQLYLRAKAVDGRRESRVERFDRLEQYYIGKPELPHSSKNMEDVYKAIQRKARLNLAELSVEATRDRMILTGFRMASGDDTSGDDAAREVAKANDFDVLSSDVHRNMMKFGVAYVIVGPPDEDTGHSVITNEDPRLCVTAHDPANPRIIRAALKMMYDTDMQQSYAFLYMRNAGGNASIHVATSGQLKSRPVSSRFVANTWEWDENGVEGRELPFPQVPVVRFLNRDGVAEFEHHTDIIDRINFMILQRLIIAMYQAFRQRVVKGDLPKEDEDGNEIDYADVFAADPGAVWLLPEDVELWEGGQADMAGNLQSVKDDVQNFAAVTRTPMYYFSSDAAQGSAEGASLQREGSVFKAEDRINRASSSWETVAQLAFRWEEDEQRSAFGAIEAIFASPERHSLSERADAASKAGTDFPWEDKLSEIWQLPPDVIKRMRANRMADVLLNPELVLGETAAPAAAAEEPAAPTAEAPAS